MSGAPKLTGVFFTKYPAALAFIIAPLDTDAGDVSDGVLLE
jgi:hypothetical protein